MKLHDDRIIMEQFYFIFVDKNRYDINTFFLMKKNNC